MQLTIYDVLAELERAHDAAAELPRLGEGPELGLLLLQPLFARGWRLQKPVTALGGAKLLWILVRGTVEVKAEGRTLGDVATALFTEAGRMSGVLE
jgi:hypothetical protein